MRQQLWFKELYTINSNLLREVDHREQLKIEPGSLLRNYRGGIYTIVSKRNGFVWAKCNVHPQMKLKGKVIKILIVEAEDLIRKDVAANRRAAAAAAEKKKKLMASKTLASN